MIPIKTANIENICKNYCDAILSYFEKPKVKKKIGYINRTISDLLIKNDDVTDLIKALPEKLNKYVSSYNGLKPLEKLRMFYAFYSFPSYYRYLVSEKKFKYKNFMTPYLAKSIINDLNIKVCPYCNRNFIIDSPKIRSSEFDHFYPQNKYPFLAISFYNLVPSCKVCNHGKESQDEDIIHPYDKEYKFDKIEFDYEATGVGFLYDESQIKIKLKHLDSPDDSKLKGSKQVFDLETLYQYHRDVVMELIQKREVYTDEYLRDLVKYMGEKKIHLDRGSLLRLITGNFVEEENLSKRPLAKLNRDIAKKLGFL
ncbi:MAG: HNH endonuclease [bacterium]